MGMQLEPNRDRILTTHVGSLPRPEALATELLKVRAGEPYDAAAMEQLAYESVRRVVQRQTEVGIDAVSDGEQSKPGFMVYVEQRLRGFGGDSAFNGQSSRDALDFPGLGRAGTPGTGQRPLVRYQACMGPIAYQGHAALRRDIANFQEALANGRATAAFMTAATPGTIAMNLSNQHYPTDEAYLYALADAMQEEYEEIAAAGLILQLDAPDLAMLRHRQWYDRPLAEFRQRIQLHVEVINHAVRNIPPAQMRLHVCWGNYEGPHHLDVPLAEILDVLLQARPMGLSFPAANGRHNYEWKVFQAIRLPDDKLIIPGVIDHTTNCIEHPETVADRLERYASVVGRERVLSGVDCGFGTFARPGGGRVDEDVMWAKLQALAEGARLASDRLW